MACRPGMPVSCLKAVLPDVEAEAKAAGTLAVMPQRIAIVGCGYVGSALAPQLVSLGHDVIATTTTPQRTAELAALGVHPVVVELSETPRLAAMLHDRAIVYVLVAPGRRKRSYREVYLEGVGRLPSAMVGTAVGHVIYTSSTSVYGQNSGQWVDETSATDPASESGRILVATERALLEGAGLLGVAATVLRLSGIIGPGRGPLDRLRDCAGQERRDGNEYVNLVHVDDIVAACLRLVEQPQAGVLNLSSDTPVLRREYYDRILDGAGLPRMRWVGGEGVPGGKRIRNDLVKRTLCLELRHPRA